ncbi:MAG: TIGR03936 family radical SAM-associated protein [Lachnospiraceae bacterium]|nr:TIGR03936 family radical SAM-associated protein [Lachnospiraceae bacterium]
MKYRVKFSKNGAIKYIGHLDVMRYFQKVIRRAEIPIAYSEGFSPHQILSFAFPLSVGFTSEGEYFDMELTEVVNEGNLIDMFNQKMNEGISVTNIRKLPDKSANCMASVFASKYEITIHDDILLPENWCADSVDHFSQLTIMVNKPKKKGGGFIEINLKDYLYDFSIINRTISFIVNSSSSSNIKPEFILQCVFDNLNCEYPQYGYDVHRVDIFGNAGTEENIKLVSLLDF